MGVSEDLDKAYLVKDEKDVPLGSGSVIVSWDFSRSEDVGVLLVGKQHPGRNVEIVNAFQGQEAVDIYKKLTTVNEVLTKKGE